MIHAEFSHGRHLEAPAQLGALHEQEKQILAVEQRPDEAIEALNGVCIVLCALQTQSLRATKAMCQLTASDETVRARGGAYVQHQCSRQRQMTARHEWHVEYGWAVKRQGSCGDIAPQEQEDGL